MQSSEVLGIQAMALGLSLTSQNSTKLQDELCAAGAGQQAHSFNPFPEGDQWQGDQISHRMPPRRSTRNGHNGRPRGSPSKGVNAGQPQSPTANATTSPTSVAEAPIPGGFESPVQSVQSSPVRMPDATRTHELQSRAAQDRAEGRAQRTKNLYGELKDPAVGPGSGYIGEFRRWCAWMGGRAKN